MFSSEWFRKQKILPAVATVGFEPATFEILGLKWCNWDMLSARVWKEHSLELIELYPSFSIEHYKLLYSCPPDDHKLTSNMLWSSCKAIVELVLCLLKWLYIPPYT
jgi:hypothetical protein